MRITVADVAAAAGNPVDPLRVIDARGLAEQDVAAPLTDASAAHAGKIGLAARLHAQPGIHQVVPRVPLANAIRVHGADEVDQTMGGGDEDLLRPDAVELRDRQVRQPIVGATVAGLQLADRQHAIAIGVRLAERLRHQSPLSLHPVEPAVLIPVELLQQPSRGRDRVNLQAASRVRVATNTALPLRPAQHRQRPRRPSLAAGRPRIDLLLQVQQADMTERFGAKAADLDVVLHQRPRLAALIGRRCEELPLMIESRPPRQHAADVEPLSLDLAEHVGRVHALRRRGVVGAARGVDVVIAAVETVR